MGADRQPMRDAIRVELHALRRILRQQRVVGADLFDEATIARVAAVRYHDAVIGTLLGATTGQANCYCHIFSPSSKSLLFLTESIETGRQVERLTAETRKGRAAAEAPRGKRAGSKPTEGAV
jgi:hypothetical protein